MAILSILVDNMKLNNLFFYVLLCLLLVSCKPLQSSIGSLQNTTPTIYSAYPYEVILSTEENPYPGEKLVHKDQEPIVNDMVSDFRIPEQPKADVANIYGTLKSATDGMLIGSMKVYIAKVVPLEPNGGFVYTIQQNSSPQAETDPLGRFAIMDIPEGEYTVIIRTPVIEQIALDASGEPIHLILNAGKVYNLDDIFIDWP